MFGAIVAGRLVQTNLQQIDETHFVFLLENPYEIHHLTIFLTGVSPFPDGYGATVHFAWPNAPNDWIALGGLTNARPSAIYKVKPPLPAQQAPGPAQIGIEVTSMDAVNTLLAQKQESKEKGAEMAQKVDVGKVAEKVVKNLWNYLHSFGEGQLTPQTPIPLSVFQKWYDNFTRKLGNDRGAGFLDRED